MVYITVNLVIGNGIKPISFLIDNSSNIDQVIIKAIALYNSTFLKEKALFLLKEDKKLYALKPSRKTGYPKVDMPNISFDVRLMETTYTQFSLVLNLHPEDYKFYFETIKPQIEKKEKHFDKCLIL